MHKDIMTLPAADCKTAAWARHGLTPAVLSTQQQNDGVDTDPDMTKVSSCSNGSGSHETRDRIQPGHLVNPQPDVMMFQLHHFMMIQGAEIT